MSFRLNRNYLNFRKIQFTKFFFVSILKVLNFNLCLFQKFLFAILFVSSLYPSELTKVFDSNTELNYAYLKEVSPTISILEASKSKDWKPRTEIGVPAKPNKFYFIKLPIENFSSSDEIFFQEVLPCANWQLYLTDNEFIENELELKKLERTDKTVLYKISIKNGEKKFLWIKAESKRQFLFFRILSERNLPFFEFKDILFIGFTTGSLISFIAYNLFLFFGTKDSNYLRYVLFIILTLANQLFYYGTFQEFSGIYELDISLKLIRSFYLLTFIANTYFVTRFIRIIEYSKIIDIVLKILMLIVFLGFSFYVTGILSEDISYGLLRVLVIPIGVIYLIGILFYFWKWKKIVEAKFVFQSYLLLAILVIHQTLSFSGVVSMDWMTINGATLGVNIQVFLFSLALADRLRIMKIQKEEAEFETISTKVNMLESFIRFVPKNFLQILKKDDFREIRPKDSYEGTMTVLFSDIRNFTSISEAMNSRENFEFVNSYFEKMNPIILRNGGFVDKFIGDGIMAIFPNSAESAVKAAWEMKLSIDEFLFTKEDGTKVQIQVGFGLHTGNLMLGTVGSEDHMETTVIGDVVNQASRLETMTKELECNCVISSHVYMELSEENKNRFIKKGEIPVRGKSNKIEVYGGFV
ncbi:MAG: adenylate/guanylate cyclase domain-containing protein [Leptospiraceae bacterium]|nr:adenylate/guanylate cyclase domain-containing protein [Leptospiraceae bacterium]